MIAAVLLTLSGLTLAGAATVAALFTVPSKNLASRWAWSAAGLGVAALAFAALSGTTGLLDLPAILGVVLVGGVAGAGWNPPGKRALLVAGAVCLGAATVARFLAFSPAASFLGGETIAQAIAGISLTWAVARASGFVAFLAATGAIVLGAKRPAQLRLGGLPARVYALHRALGIVSLSAIAVHLSALWLDEFIQFTAAQLLLMPWTSSYEPFGVTLGWISMLLLLLVAASGALRRWFPSGTWRIVHAFSYLTFALGLVHGLLSGTDSGSPLTLAFYLATLLAVGLAAYRRLSSPEPLSPSGRNKKSFQANAQANARPRSTIADTTS
ncbi:MAG: ferric reductase-like transmembrane domain-containing protein [Actinomycetota bacterium]|nr:ferric reductase-like transmembrane domain-containing protein [Actinomycetota bacterium]